jgi:WXG100 family type VII secretion target
MSAFKATTEDLDALGKHITEIDSQAQGILRQVRSAAETVGSTWTGQASAAFQQLMSRFDEDGRKVSQALQAIAEQITDTSKIYAQNEEEQRSAVGGITDRLS